MTTTETPTPSPEGSAPPMSWGAMFALINELYVSIRRL